MHNPCTPCLDKRWRTLCTVIIALVTLSGCSSQVEDTRPGQPVKTRQMAFKDMLRVFEPMGTMLRTDKYDAERFALLAGQLIGKRDAPWPLFGPDTHYPPTKAKATVWQEQDRFNRERQVFLAATDELMAAAQRKDKEDASRAYFKVYDLCQSCHKHFKEK
jgi:cytochrome c556